jgi:HlyD family secretion protein
MRLFLICLLLLIVLGGLGVGGNAAYKYWEQKNRPNFRTTKVDIGTIEEVVNATGEIKPILTVQIGSFVSGPIVKLEVEIGRAHV